MKIDLFHIPVTYLSVTPTLVLLLYSLLPSPVFAEREMEKADPETDAGEQQSWCLCSPTPHAPSLLIPLKLNKSSPGLHFVHLY